MRRLANLLQHTYIVSSHIAIVVNICIVAIVIWLQWLLLTPCMHVSSYMKYWLYMYAVDFMLCSGTNYHIIFFTT